MNQLKATTNLIVPSIEAALPFWLDRLGFEKKMELPHENALGFVILAKGDVELMLQSEASLGADIAAVPRDGYRAFIYVTVPSLADAKKALAGYPMLVEERTTFYGARETVVRDPAGNVVVLAEHTSS